MSSLTEKQAQTLDEFRKRVMGFVPKEYLDGDTSNSFLIRSLIARDFNIEKAEIMLENYLKWRKDNEIDSILEWAAAEDMKEACPYEISGCDAQGRPVLIFPYARWTSWDFTDTGRREEYIKYVNQILEKCVAAIKPPATQFVIVADSEGFSFRHMARLKALEANLEILRGFEAHYPEMLSVAFVVNCPKVFSVLFSVIRPLMSARTHAKLQIYDSNKKKWLSQLNQYIASDQLPPKYRIDNSPSIEVIFDKDDLLNNESCSSDDSVEVVR